MPRTTKATTWQHFLFIMLDGKRIGEIGTTITIIIMTPATARDIVRGHVEWNKRRMIDTFTCDHDGQILSELRAPKQTYIWVRVCCGLHIWPKPHILMVLPICGVDNAVQITNSCHKAAFALPLSFPFSGDTGVTTFSLGRSSNEKLPFLADCAL